MTYFRPLQPIALGLVTAKAGQRAAQAVKSKRRALREAAAPRVDGESFDLDTIYVRDKARGCCICKLPVPREHASLEHVVPLSAGGEHTEANVKLAHKKCNSRKGARTAPRKRGLRRKAFKPKARPKPPEEEGGMF